jgi:anti-anti-sigma factor
MEGAGQGMQPEDISFTDRNGIHFYELPEIELTYECLPPLKNRLSQSLEGDGATALVLDLCNVEFVDATALSVILGVHRRSVPKGLPVIVDLSLNKHPEIYKWFKLCGLVDLIHVVPPHKLEPRHSKTI